MVQRLFHRKYLHLALLLCVRLRADAPGVGTTSANFLKLGSSARSEAMGEAYVALADDAGGIGYNPAGMLNLEESSIQATHTSWFGGVSYELLNLVQAINTGQAVGYGFSYINLPQQSVTQASGLNTGNVLDSFRQIGSINPYDMRVNLAYAQQLGWGIKAGAVLNVLEQSVGNNAATGLGVDLGALMEPMDHLEVGLSLQNLGPSVSLISQSFGLPMLVRLGLSYVIKDRILLSTEAGLPNDNNFYAGLGAEFMLNEYLYLRGGYRYDSIFNPYSAGLGIKMPSAMLDIAWVPMGELGQTYRVSLAWNWGGWISGDQDIALEVVQGVLLRNGSGQYSEISLQPRMREPRRAKDWAVYIYGGTPSAVLRQYSGLGSFGGSVNWDGMDAKGMPVADGVYQAVLTVRLKSGKVMNSTYQQLLVDPPMPEPSLEIASNSMPPGQTDTIFVTTDFKILVPGGTAGIPIKWRLDIYNTNHVLFQSIEGKLPENQEYKWNGVNAMGEQFVSNSDYQFQLSLLDAKGKVLKTASPITKHCVFRY